MDAVVRPIACASHKMSCSWTLATILRSPQEHAASHSLFNYALQVQNAHRHAYVAPPYQFELLQRNPQAQYILAGHLVPEAFKTESFKANEDNASTHTVGRVLHKLQLFNLVGFTEELESFVAALDSLWGVSVPGKPPSLTHVNPSLPQLPAGTDADREAHSDANRELIAQSTAVDAAVYIEMLRHRRNTRDFRMRCNTSTVIKS